MVIQGHGQHAVLHPVVTKEAAHINHMVQKQRKPIKRRPRFRYRELEMENMSNDSSQYTVNRNAEFLLWNPVQMSQVNKKPPSELNCSIPSLPSTIAESFPADRFGKGALPDIDSDDEVFFMGYPSDAIRFAHDIQFLNGISDAMEPINGFYSVRVKYVRTPYKFWFQLDDKGKFNGMSEELQNFYENLPDEELLIPETDIREKRACAARFEGRWYRGEIVSEVPDPDGDYKIFCLDIGNVAAVSPKSIKFLMKTFGTMPRQAYRGRLASVKPKHMRWSRKSARKLMKFVDKLVLYAKVEHFNQEDNSHYLKLLHTYTEDDIDVAEYLIAKCSDVLSCEPKGKTSPALTIPTFKMLEKGLTPLTNEFFD